MNKRRQLIRLPASISAGSLLILIVIALTTSPVKDIAYAVAFFISLLIFMISLGYTVVCLQLGEVNPRDKFRIIVVSIFILVLLMFRSAQSLSWIDAVVVILIIAGLLFYSGRRL